MRRDKGRQKNTEKKIIDCLAKASEFFVSVKRTFYLQLRRIKQYQNRAKRAKRGTVRKIVYVSFLNDKQGGVGGVA